MAIDEYHSTGFTIETRYSGKTTYGSQEIIIQSQYAPPVRIRDFKGAPSVEEQMTQPRRIPRINKLPPEVMGDILRYSMQDWTGLPVERLMAVCRCWMHVCLATPSLWTKIRLNMAHWLASNLHENRCNYLFHHLSRSGILPMQIEIDISPSVNHPNDLRNHVEFAQGLLHFLFTGGPTKKSAETWTELTVTYKDSTPRRLLDFLGSSMPTLQVLTLQGNKDVKIPVMDLPSLRSFIRIGSPISTGLSPSGLFSLTLEQATLTADEVIQFSDYRNLQSLILHDNIQSDSRLPKVEIPNLKTLEIRASQALSLRFLVLPRLDAVTVTGDYFSLNAASSLRNISQIRRLVLTNTEWLLTMPSPTIWGFPAYVTRLMDALPLETSFDAMSRLLSKCTDLEVLLGTSDAVQAAREVLGDDASLCPRLARIQSRRSDIISLNRIARSL